MKSFLLALFASALCSSAIRLPLQSKRSAVQRRSGGTTASVVKVPQVMAVSSSQGEMSLATANDYIYITNITVGGTEYPVQIDTGSSDLWIQGSSFPLSNSNTTSMTYNLTYGIGWANGNISTAEVDFAGIKIPNQAFLDASTAKNPALQYGANGILGLGFTSLSSLDYAVNASGGSWGRSVLFNAFLDNPSEPNYMTFALQRSADPTADDVIGTFTIGEVDPTYQDVTNAQAISTWPPVNPSRWDVLIDGFIVGTTSYSVTTGVSSVPGGKAVALLDSGTSWTYCPTAVATAIYGGISGAQYSDALQQWIVPCDAEIDMAIQIDGQVFPLHPLDVAPVSSTNTNECVGSFVPQDISVSDGEFDWLLGVNFLRSVYSMYDFGDFDSSGKMGNPYIKLLSIINPNNASAEFVAARGGIAKTNITYNASPGTGSNSGSTSVTLADNIADKLNELITYIPVVLGILALNAIALLTVAVAVVCYLVKSRRGRKSFKKNRNMLPLSARAPTPYPGALSGSAMDMGDGHEYEQVSIMAPEPEDMPFTPPPFGIRDTSYDGDTIQPLRPISKFSGRRPHSTISGLNVPPDYRVSAAPSEATAFVPPSPPFKKGDDRPKSIA